MQPASGSRSNCGVRSRARNSDGATCARRSRLHMHRSRSRTAAPIASGRAGARRAGPTLNMQDNEQSGPISAPGRGTAARRQHRRTVSNTDGDGAPMRPRDEGGRDGPAPGSQSRSPRRRPASTYPRGSADAAGRPGDASAPRQTQPFVNVTISTLRAVTPAIRKWKEAPPARQFLSESSHENGRTEGKREQEGGNEAGAPQGVLVRGQGQGRKDREGHGRGALRVGAHREAEVEAAGEVSR